MIRALLVRELILLWRTRSDWWVAFAFFIIVLTIFPFGLGADERLLAEIVPGVVWVAALLAVLLNLPRLFEADWRNGTLEQLFLMPQPIVLWLLVKLFAYWLVAVAPLALLAPLGVLFYAAELQVALLLSITLLLGTPALTLIGAVGAALTLGVRTGAALLGLLVLPLFVPVLIFGVDAVYSARAGLSFSGQLLVLGSGSLLALVLAPWACGAALKLAVE